MRDVEVQDFVFGARDRVPASSDAPNREDPLLEGTEGDQNGLGLNRIEGDPMDLFEECHMIKPRMLLEVK